MQKPLGWNYELVWNFYPPPYYSENIQFSVESVSRVKPTVTAVYLVLFSFNLFDFWYANSSFALIFSSNLIFNLTI